MGDKEIGNTEKEFKIGRKTLISVVVVILGMSILLGFLGIYVCKAAIQKIYNDQGYIIGEVLLGEVDCDRIGKYADTLEKDEEYENILEFVKLVQKKTQVKYVYFFRPTKEHTIQYIVDSSGMDLGEEEPLIADYDKVNSVFVTGKRADDYFIRKSPLYGELTSSILPVINSKGETVAVLCIDISMDIIEKTLKNYILVVVLITLIILVLFCFLYWFYLNRAVITPIAVIDKCVSSFLKSDDSVTKELNNVKTGDELEKLAKSILLMEYSIGDYITNITEVTKEKERIGTELTVATRIQSAMLPNVFPDFEDNKYVLLNATMNPAKEVGGDFFDFFFVDDDNLCLVCADVSGKGVPAALFMVIAKTIIKNYAKLGLTPGEVLKKANEQLCEGNDYGLFVTVWLAKLNVKTGVGIAANAGHEHPAIRPTGGDYEFNKYKHSIAVATFEESEFKEHEFKLNPGDTLFVYTDGVTEALNLNKEFYGEDRLINALNKNKELLPVDLLPAIKSDIDNFVGEAQQFDDITMLAIKLREICYL